MSTKVCEGCGIEVEAERSTRRFCDKCGTLRTQLAVKRYEQRHRNEKGLREPGSAATCQWCNGTFLALRSDAKTCSPECKRQANLAKARRFEATHRGICNSCGATITRRCVQCRKCSQPGRIAKVTGPGNYAWKGGRVKDGHGYIHILVAPEARKGHRYQPEHRLVWEAANGPIPEGFVIHHVNGIKDDNRVENLEAMPRKKHNHRHDEHDKRILELEDEVRRLKAQLDATQLGSTANFEGDHHSLS